MSKKKASLPREKPLTVVGNPEALQPKLEAARRIPVR